MIAATKFCRLSHFDEDNFTKLNNPIKSEANLSRRFEFLDI
jgi:hypothetical protein